MKLLLVCSTLDLDYPHNATPALWQLFKGLYEIGCELVVIPYRGRAIRSLWWRCYDNPCRREGELYFHFRQIFNKNPLTKSYPSSLRPIKQNDIITPKIARLLNNSKWRARLDDVLRIEKDIEALVFIGVPLNQFNEIASFVKTKHNIPVVYYDLDVPTSLPEFGGFTFNYYIGADLSEYDAFIIPSEGSAPTLKKLGARKVFILHFGVDPEVYKPLNCPQEIDVFFFGGGCKGREHSIKTMITDPSRALCCKFVVSGWGFDEMGQAILIPSLPFSRWRAYSCGSKINLSIPRENHARTYATSTSRAFELAAMGCCVVSSPQHGLEKWFDIGHEIIVARSTEESIDVYQNLLKDSELRSELGKRARKRVLKEHTHKHRAHELLRILNSVS